MTLSNGQKIGFDSEKIALLLIQANQKKPCKIAAKVIAKIMAE